VNPVRVKADLGIPAAPLPFPISERGNFAEIHSKKTESEHKSLDYTDPEIRDKAIEGRRFATPKHVFAAAIQRKCEECTGVNPAVTDCNGGEGVNDGLPCRLYHVNTREKRRKTTKTRLRRAIIAECHFCLGNWTKKRNPLSDCSSPSCPLYEVGAGPAVAKKEGREP